MLVKTSNAQEMQSVEVFRTLNITVKETLIQKCNEYAEKVYFVDNNSGAAYGSTVNKDEAIQLAKVMQGLLEA